LQKVRDVATGKIKTLMKDRGFGFIAVSGSEDVFFHSSSLPEGLYDSLQAGQSVEFDIEADPRNPRRTRAANLRVSA
jgi:CspA family cold shock protein